MFADLWTKRAWGLACVLSLGASLVAAQTLDSDGDGVSDASELEYGDRDGDGLENHLDPDDDNDTRLTRDEEDGSGRDRDGDGTPDYLDTDEDDDGLRSLQEDANADGQLGSGDDTDGDGLIDPLDADDDQDTVATRLELGPSGASNPRDTDGDLRPDFRDADDDGDGVSSRDELLAGEVDGNGNGIPAQLDPLERGGSNLDSDGDGLLDGAEQTGDSDGDGKPNRLDDDDDDDGVRTQFEDASRMPAQDSDGDAVADYLDVDDDGDGLPTSAEQPDPNGDGRVDDARSTVGSERDYLNPDDDQDGVATKLERPNQSNVDTDGDGTFDHYDGDDDGDGRNTASELGRDSDGDGVSDHLESDDDGDGLATKEECAPELPADFDRDGLANCIDGDADGDTVPDSVEGKEDRDRNGRPDYLDAEAIPADADNDGVPDARECSPDAGACPDSNGDGESDPLDPDDDGDGVSTRDEQGQQSRDSDGDGLADYRDPDDDDDGVPSLSEVAGAAVPRDTDRDGTPDYLDLDDDGDGVPTRAEGQGDDDGDGTANYLDAVFGVAADAGVALDGGVDAGKGLVPPLLSAARKSDDGCSLVQPGRGESPLGLLLSLSLLFALSLRRSRGRASVGLLALALDGCDEERGLTVLDGGVLLDASRDGSIGTDGDTVDARIPVEPGCAGDELVFPLALTTRPAFALAVAGNTAHLALLSHGCSAGAAVPIADRLRSLRFALTGAVLDDGPSWERDCLELREPALARVASGALTLFVGAEEVGDVFQAKQDGGAALVALSSSERAHDFGLAAATLAGASAPTLAFVSEAARAPAGEPAAILSVQPGKVAEQILGVDAQQRASRLALGPLALAAAPQAARGIALWVNGAANNRGIYARRVDDVGRGLGEVVSLSRSVGAQSAVAITQNALVYSESRDGELHELRFRTVDAAGSFGAPVKLTGASEDVIHFAISPFRDGYAVAYRNRGSALNPQTQLQLLFVDQRGNLGGVRHVAETTASGTRVAMVASADGRLVLAWDEQQAADAGGREARLRVRRLTCN